MWDKSSPDCALLSTFSLVHKDIKVHFPIEHTVTFFFFFTFLFFTKNSAHYLHRIDWLRPLLKCGFKNININFWHIAKLTTNSKTDPSPLHCHYFSNSGSSISFAIPSSFWLQLHFPAFLFLYNSLSFWPSSSSREKKLKTHFFFILSGCQDILNH